ncbi:MAG: acyl-CoA dehydrogenase [Dehalococcoidia bacterium]|nr:acyl-CoA dehydrogenase [Dehalococcoidia bacterium]
MDLGLNEMQEMLRRTARAFFENECPKSVVRQAEQDERGYSPELWRKIAAQGWTGMTLPAEYGGGGASFLDLALFYEEVGRALAPVPYLDVALSAFLLQELGSEQQKREWLPQLASGNLIATVALVEPAASYDADSIHLTASSQGPDYVLNGVKLFISNAHIADRMLVVARTKESANPEDGLTVFLVDPHAPGVSITLLQTLASDRQCEVVFENVKVPAVNVVGPVDGAWPALKSMLGKARVLLAAWSVGGAEFALEMTVEYAKTRVQFGRPIGSFQAISHKCADMAIDCDTMRYGVYHAAWRLAEGLAAGQEIAIAKAWSADAYRRVTALAEQVHGGVGYMMEHDIQLYFRRAKAAELLFGDADYHREVVAVGMGL